MSGVLCDLSIRQAVRELTLLIDPFVEEHVQPASYDLTVSLDAPLCLNRGEFHLLSTVERVGLPGTIQGQVHGRSSLGRLGLMVHFTSGFIDPGFVGQITLEVMAFYEEVLLQPGDRVAQISFYWLDKACGRPYRGRYQNQSGPTLSRFAHGDG